LLVISVSGS